ncbi:MAG: hypothetical protein NVS4B3_22880 [Gemmatimonadaceae bacterium]
MSSDLSQFDLAEMLRCCTGIRRATRDVATTEAAAQAICRFLYDELVDSAGERACALVRCYKTHAYGALDSDLQQFVRGGLPATLPPDGTLNCLVLLGTVGEEKAWNDRRASRGHRAIPLPDPEIVAKAPMIAQLLRQLGVDLAEVVKPSPKVVHELEGKSYGVFHVEDARGSEYIPAQATFVKPYGVRSVVGFGGALVGGDIFAVVLFARVPISPDAAARFRRVALEVKASFFPFDADHVFGPTLVGPQRV